MKPRDLFDCKFFYETSCHYETTEISVISGIHKNTITETPNKKKECQ